MSDVGEFLKSAAAERAPWNCSTLPADWCLTLGYPDFAEQWRDIVEVADCEAVAADGLVALWDRGIGDALPSFVPDDPDGSLPVEMLQPGDIVVVALEHIDEAGAIWTGQRLAVKASRGLHFLPPDGLRIMKAWRP
jgi:hypothetical protein